MQIIPQHLHAYMLTLWLLRTRDGHGHSVRGVPANVERVIVTFRPHA